MFAGLITDIKTPMRNTVSRLHYPSPNLYTGTFLAPSKEIILIYPDLHPKKCKL
jgi:hypothetical protein